MNARLLTLALATTVLSGVGAATASPAVTATTTASTRSTTTGVEAVGPSWLTPRGGDLRQGRVRDPRLTRADVAALTPAWSSTSPSISQTEVAVSGDAVFAPLAGRELARLRLDDGTPVWRRTLPAEPTAPTIDHARVYVLAGSTVLGLEATTGATGLSTRVPLLCGDGGDCSTGLGTASGRAVAGNGAKVSVVDLASGAVLSTTSVRNNDPDSGGGGIPAVDADGTAWYSFKWTGSIAVVPGAPRPLCTPKISGNGQSTALVLGDTVFVQSSSKGISAFDRLTGAKTELAPGATGDHRPMATDGTRLFDVTSERSASALTAYRVSDGVAVWSHPGAATAPLVVGDVVVVGEGSRGIAFYDTASGALVRRIAGTARGADPVVVGDRLLLGYSDAALPASTLPPLTMLTVPATLRSSTSR